MLSDVAGETQYLGVVSELAQKYTRRCRTCSGMLEAIVLAGLLDFCFLSPFFESCSSRSIESVRSTPSGCGSLFLRLNMMAVGEGGG